MYYETSKRTILKTILWRIIATMNSYLILTAAITHDNFLNTNEYYWIFRVLFIRESL